MTCHDAILLRDSWQFHLLVLPVRAVKRLEISISTVSNIARVDERPIDEISAVDCR